jgi:hypothetical protein
MEGLEPLSRSVSNISGDATLPRLGHVRLAGGGRTARNLSIVGSDSISSRHRQKLGYMALPFSVRPKAKVLGSK